MEGETNGAGAGFDVTPDLKEIAAPRPERPEEAGEKKGPSPAELRNRAEAIKPLLRMAGGVHVLVADKLTDGLVRQEANYTEQEIDVLAKALAPFLPNVAPWMALIGTIIAVEGNKVLTIRNLYSERRQEKDADRTTDEGSPVSGAPTGILATDGGQ